MLNKNTLGPLKNALLGICLWLAHTEAFSNDYLDVIKDPTPDFGLGAKTFQNKCALCHGNYAMGDGVLPLILDTYPNTNLFKLKHLKSLQDREATKAIIVNGISKGDFGYLMPPWGNELTWTEIESLTLFLSKLEQHPELAQKKLSQIADRQVPSVEYGRKLYKGRCVNCHGEFAEGNGRLAKIIKDPSPSNLRETKSTDDYMKKIIQKGGKAIGRSDRMPPWGEELTTHDINAVILYIRSLQM